MAKAKAQQVISAEYIADIYMDYILTNEAPPTSVYMFTKASKFSEAEFYNYFASFESIERNEWESLIRETISVSTGQEVWSQYSSREKMLSFFYSFLELLKTKRSFILYTLKHNRCKISTPFVLAGTKYIFENFAEQVIQEGLESGELANRKIFTNRYKDALWLQFKFILQFWINDSSPEFEKTDEVVEKGINVTFDLFQRSPIDTLFEYGKFLAQNSRIKEKMGI